MPLGFERLNERTSRPNALINFIKPLPGHTHDTALHILNRVAARCYPIMKAHHIAVMSLEEYAPNPEFVGRNFNAGEVIQLVLKSRDGRWLSVKQVEMVLMHELAHCKQMNHSRYFWQVRDVYAADLVKLWGRGYMGEGLWGRGRELEGGRPVNEDQAVDLGNVEHLCGGTYRSRGRKRKRGRGAQGDKKESWAERKQRRILRKFGAGGTALGANEEVKTELEGGKKVKGKPRVANSARGRELRAAAALARFEQVKAEQELGTKKEEQSDGSDTEDDEEDVVEGPTARDVNGKELRDAKGDGLVKIEDEDQEDPRARKEMDELQELRQQKITQFIRPSSPPDSTPAGESPSSSSKAARKITSARTQNRTNTLHAQSQPRPPPPPTSTTRAQQNAAPPPPSQTPPSTLPCPICTLLNPTTALTCIACANVLQPGLVQNGWRCRSRTCKTAGDGGGYRNAGYCGVCGVCGALKPGEGEGEGEGEGA